MLIEHLVALLRQVRYFKSLPSLMPDVRAVAAQMASSGDLPTHKTLHSEAQAATDNITSVGHRHSARKQHAVLAAT